MKWLLPVVGIALAACLIAWNSFADRATVRYRVSVTIEMDGSSSSGTAVRDASFSRRYSGITTGTIEASVRGEAIPIVLPTGETIYVLRRSSNAPTTLGYGGFIAKCLPDDPLVHDFYGALRKLKGGCVASGARPMIVSVAHGPAGPQIAIVRYSDDGSLAPQLTDRVVLDKRVVDVITVTAETTTDPITNRLTPLDWVRALPHVGYVRSYEDFHREDFTTLE